LFLAIYIIILLGHGTIWLITKVEPTLHTPMYYFLGNFSFLEICYVSVTHPRMLVNLGTQRRSISLLACATQMCFVLDWEPQSVFFWLWCPMTTMWSFVTLWTILHSWITRFVPSWWLAPGSVEFQSR
jgi:hypothetical protein